MGNAPSLMISNKDYERLSRLTQSMNSEVAALLEQELDRAAIFSPEEIPGDVVVMNSVVHFTDLDTGGKSVVTLVYPHEADIETNKVSVLAPVGAALIGLRAGQTIDWPMPHGKIRRRRIEKVQTRDEDISAAER